MKTQSTQSVQHTSAPAAEFVGLAGRAQEHPLQRSVDFSKRQTTQAESLAQLRSAPERDKPNGLPRQLRAGIETLSGMDMSDVVVRRNSAKPAQLNALAYAQGRVIHLGAGQERHLPHEAWHVVQQAQGRVRPTRQLKGGVPVNDDISLEHEADVMGTKATQSFAHAVGTKAAGNDNPDLKKGADTMGSMARSLDVAETPTLKAMEGPGHATQRVVQRQPIENPFASAPAPPGLIRPRTLDRNMRYIWRDPVTESRIPVISEEFSDDSNMLVQDDQRITMNVSAGDLFAVIDDDLLMSTRHQSGAISVLGPPIHGEGDDEGMTHRDQMLITPENLRFEASRRREQLEVQVGAVATMILAGAIGLMTYLDRQAQTRDRGRGQRLLAFLRAPVQALSDHANLVRVQWARPVRTGLLHALDPRPMPIPRRIASVSSLLCTFLETIDVLTKTGFEISSGYNPEVIYKRIMGQREVNPGTSTRAMALRIAEPVLLKRNRYLLGYGLGNVLYSYCTSLIPGLGPVTLAQTVWDGLNMLNALALQKERALNMAPLQERQLLIRQIRGARISGFKKLSASMLLAIPAILIWKKMGERLERSAKK